MRGSRAIGRAVLAGEDSHFFLIKDLIRLRWQSDREGLAEKNFPWRFPPISQQLAKLFISRIEKSLRKLKEAVITAGWNKSQQAPDLELYLNVIEWGDDFADHRHANMQYPAAKICQQR